MESTTGKRSKRCRPIAGELPVAVSEQDTECLCACNQSVYSHDRYNPRCVYNSLHFV